MNRVGSKILYRMRPRVYFPIGLLNTYHWYGNRKDLWIMYLTVSRHKVSCLLVKIEKDRVRIEIKRKRKRKDYLTKCKIINK